MTNSTLANEFVTDTMGLVLRIERRKLGPTVKSIFDSVESGNTTIYVPAMVIAEILYLSEKQRISISLSEVGDYLKQYPNCKEYPMSFAVIQSAAQINDIGELHDRLIAGTARLLNLALITNDPIIQASAFVKTVW
ncbi:PIN domain-containing protein [Candidatus Poribacteria bacterium]|nr:PIN domain-containing protein [Candidatus Poribacteria bacterium]